MAPEVVNRQGHSHSADWWSYGVLMVRTQLECLETWLSSCSHGSSEAPLHDSAHLADVLAWGWMFSKLPERALSQAVPASSQERVLLREAELLRPLPQ